MFVNRTLEIRKQRAERAASSITVFVGYWTTEEQFAETPGMINT